MFESKGRSHIFEEVMPAQFLRSVLFLECVCVSVCG